MSKTSTALLLACVVGFGQLALLHAQNQGEQSLPLVLAPPLHEPVTEGRGALKVVSPRDGTLAYSFQILEPGTTKPRPNFLVLARPLKSSSDLTRAAFSLYSVAQRPSDSSYSDVIFDPQFSPDGRLVLFKFGTPTLFSATYQLYVFDSHSQSLSLATNETPSYRWVSWSPDGNYLAYITGGDVEGNTTRVVPGTDSDEIYTGPLKLCLCNWRTKKTEVVATNDTLRGPFSWSGPHTLVYGMLPKETADKSAPKQANYPIGAVVRHPNVYSYSLEVSSSRQLIGDAYLPMPSPNGKWIVFYGSEHPDKPLPLRPSWEVEPQGASLSVFDAQKNQRIALNREGGLYSFMCWLPDNRHFLELKQTKSSISSEAEIREWDVQTRKFRVIRTLTSNDYKFTPRSVIEPPFQILGLSQDSKAVFISISEKISHEPTVPKKFALIRNRNTIQAIDIASGAVTTIVQIQGFSGSLVSWRDDNAP